MRRWRIGHAALVLGMGLGMAAAAEPTTGPAGGSAGNLLKDTSFNNLGTGDGGWAAQSNDAAVVEVAKDTAAPADRPALVIDVQKVTGTDWHAQVYQSGLSVMKDNKYTLTFTARATAPRQVAVFVQELSSPYKMLTEGHAVALTTADQPQSVTFTATADSADAKLTIVVGQATGKVILSNVSLVHDHS